MQQERAAFNSFPETIDLNQGSFPSNISMDHSESWDINVNPVDNRLSGNISYTCAGDSHQSRGWINDESSSNSHNLQERACNDDSSMRLGWAPSLDDCPGTRPIPEDWWLGPSATRNSNRSLNLQIDNPNRVSLDINSNQGHHSEIERVPTFYTSSSNNGISSGTLLENNDLSGLSFGTWGSSCKRKSREGTSSGQFYSGGSSSSNNSLQHSVHGPRNLNLSSQPQNLSPTNPIEHLNVRNGVGSSSTRVAPRFFPSSSAPGVSAGVTRNFTVRSNLVQHDSVPYDTHRGTSVRDSNNASRQRSRYISNTNSSEWRSETSFPINPNNTINQPHLMHANEVTGMHPYPWNRSFSSHGGSSSNSFTGSGERSSRVHGDSAHVTRNSHHNQIDWSFAPETSAASRNSSSGSRIGSSSDRQSILALQNQALINNQRLSEAVPWNPSSRIESDFGIHGSHFEFFPLGTSSSSVEPATISHNTPHPPDQRSAPLVVDMPGDTINSWRGLAAVEARHRMIHQVLSTMRRGGRLQPEDYVLIDPYINGFAEMHDRHRDLRLDVDNMSYEELLALEEQIGDVNTGLSEEKIGGSMNQRKYKRTKLSTIMEPCCICQEDYIAGDNIGILDCGHEFHTSCVKKWLILKNLCPICKLTALKT